MATPFDPQYMPGANERAIALANVAAAIAQAKVLDTYADAQIKAIEQERTNLEPIMPGGSATNEELERQQLDLQDVKNSIDRYLNALNGYQIEETEGQPNIPDMPQVPQQVKDYVKSIIDGKPYVEPTHTG